MPFFLHPKQFVRMVLTKVLSLLFTLMSAIFAQIRHLVGSKCFCNFELASGEVESIVSRKLECFSVVRPLIRYKLISSEGYFSTADPWSFFHINT